tara:strand:+ start:414 stop:707 length:294 start_codon:yes stop_codon:yes gene_type:complete
MKRTEQKIQEILDSNFNEAVEDMQRLLTARIACLIRDQNFKSRYINPVPNGNIDFRDSLYDVQPGAYFINDISDIVSEYLADKGILLDVEQEEQTNE